MPRKSKINNNSKIRDQASFRKTRLMIYNIKFIYKFFIFISLFSIIFFFNYSKKFNYNINNYIYKKLADDRFLGLKLRNVYLEGQNHTLDKDIVKALSVNIGQPILSISLDKLKTKLEKLSWVKEAIIERRLPSILYVNIIEKEPVALWQNKGKLYLIDIEGKIIYTDKINQFTNLILLIGNDAPFHYANLLPIIAKNKRIFEYISSLTRIGERRWNIKMKTGTEIKLPENNEEQAWDIILKLFDKNKLTNEVKIIDLRIDGKIYLNGEIENF